MATPRYPENPVFEALGKTAFNVGQQVARQSRRGRRQPVDLAQFEGTRKVVQSSQAPQTAQEFVRSGTITTPFGGRTRFEQFHPGLDIAQPEGTPVPAFTGGKVSAVKTGQVQTSTTPGFGNYVIVQDRFGNRFRYSHLQNSLVKVGQEVAPGTVVGTVGRTGGAYSTSGGSGSHLDLRIRDAYGRYVDPNIFIS